MWKCEVLKRLSDIEQTLLDIVAILNKSIERDVKMSAELDDLRAQVAKNTDVEESAVTLLKGLKDKLDAAIAAGDPKALTDLSAALGKSQGDLAAAIAASTPADPTTNPPTPTTP